MPPYPVQGFAPSLHSRQTLEGSSPKGHYLRTTAKERVFRYIENSAKCRSETPEANLPLAKTSAKVRDSLPGTTLTTYLVLAEVSLNKSTTVFEKGKSDAKILFTPLEEKYLWGW